MSIRENGNSHMGSKIKINDNDKIKLRLPTSSDHLVHYVSNKGILL